jgi:hypothetical protein
MIGALRSLNKWDEESSGGGLLIAAELVRDANATKANTANFDGCSRRQHTHCGLFPALVDSPVVVSLRAKLVCGKTSHAAGHLRSLQSPSTG